MHFVKEMQLVRLIWRSMMGKFSGGKKTPRAQLWRWKEDEDDLFFFSSMEKNPNRDTEFIGREEQP